MATASKINRKGPVASKPAAKKAAAPEAAQQALPLEEGQPKPAEPAPQTTRLDVSCIDILDLRDLSVPARFHALNMLSEAGYLLAGALDRPAIEHFHLVHDVDAFKLQHNNKLIFTMQWFQVKEGEKIAKVAGFRSHTDVAITEPSALPDPLIKVEGHLYERVGAHAGYCGQVD